jgi:hypothetical protein
MKFRSLFLVFFLIFNLSCSGRSNDERDLVYGQNLVESCLFEDDHEFHTFFPKNDLKIGPSEMSGFSNISEARFNQILGHVESVYSPIFRARGGELRVIKNWSAPDVNAAAWGQGDRKNIEFYGGLARHHNATEDMLYLIACHEIGHHLGGAPRYTGFEGLFCGSTEGQSDYFSTLKCLRKVWKDENNSISGAFPDAISLCSGRFATQDEEDICVRSIMAGLDSATMSHTLGGVASGSSPPAIWNSANWEVDETMEFHPHPQCRLDTYIQGAICEVSEDVVLTTNPNDGACSRFNNQFDGARPLCWFKPARI